MPNTFKNPELVTVRPKVTVSDGLRGLEWLSIFKAASLQTTVTNRHSRLEPSLEPSLIAPKAENSPFRRANDFVFAPANIAPARGAARICQMLQAFATVLRASRENRLPLSPLEVGLCGEMFDVESAAAACIEIEKSWTERARACQLAKRDLTPEETTSLEIAGEFLEGIGACWNGDAWRDLEETDLQSRNSATNSNANEVNP